ncbi:hypothetical protein BSKO_06839 [Bryopsis sp. KO-2023]|nr:hypothetical protein BSKO_06839 [Bryopsis sp. KO-2023]
MNGMMYSSTRLSQHAVGTPFRNSFARQNRRRVHGAVRGRRGGSTVTSSLQYEIDGGVVRVKPAKDRECVTVLSIDGGGVRGLIPAVVLLSVEKEIIRQIKGKEIQIDMADFFDCISGTSVGCIVALYLASKGGSDSCNEEIRRLGIRPGSVEGIVKLIEKNSEIIFPSPWYSWIPFFGDLLGYAKLFFQPKFASDGVEKSLKDVFGEMTLKDVKTASVVPTFELSGNRAFSFWTHDGDTGYAALKPRSSPRASSVRKQAKPLRSIQFGEDGLMDWDPDVRHVGGHNYKLWQVARASTAAPTFFPAPTFAPVEGSKDSATFVDGGVVANNPTMQSIVFMEYNKKCSLKDIAVLSLGTGHAQPDTAKLNNAGAFGWVVQGGALMSILMDGSSEFLQSLVDISYYQTLKTQLAQYVRISVCVDQEHKDEQVLSEMDNPKNLTRLREIGNELGVEYKRPIKEFVEDFLLEIEADECHSLGEEASGKEKEQVNAGI